MRPPKFMGPGPNRTDNANHELKKTLYSRLAKTYFLPPLTSTGLNRKYLDKVEAGTVFRVKNQDLNKFLADLNPKHFRKAAFTSKYQAYSKVERLLKEKGEGGLGFEGGLIPDGEWLYRVARWVDPSDVCCLFEVPVEGSVKGNTDSHKVALSKKSIEHDLFITSGLDEVEEVREAIEELKLSHQRFTSRNAELNHLSAYGRQLTREVEGDKRDMETKLASLALLVYTRGEKLGSEEGLKSGDGKRQEVHLR